MKRCAKTKNYVNNNFLFILIWIMCVVLTFQILTPRPSGADTYKDQVAVTRLESFSESLVDFKDDIGRFPTMEEGLRALLERPATISNETWKGPYVDRPDIPPDPWLKDYLYIYPPKFGSEEFDLYSTGQNEVDDHGLKDDITNWKPVDHAYYPHSSNNNLWFLGVALFITLFLLITFLIKKRFSQSRDDRK